jgi:hypothetical protein
MGTVVNVDTQSMTNPVRGGRLITCLVVSLNRQLYQSFKLVAVVSGESFKL